MLVVKPVEDVLEIRFKAFLDISKFTEVVNKIKQIPGRQYHSGTDSHWSIPESCKPMLDSLFKSADIVWENTLEDVVLMPKNISMDTSHFDKLLLQPYPFQVLGINFLCEVGSGMLADEMGLGKTAEILIAIYKLFRQGKVKRSLIICPATLKYQWEEEIVKFIDVTKYDIDYVIVDGDVKGRKALYDSLASGEALYTVINYELVRNDIQYLEGLGFDVIALDEAHRIKNWKSKTSEAIKKLDAPFKWAATGTPMQNRPDELFNIFSWIDPKVFGDWWKFRGRYIVIGEKFRQPNMVLGYRNLGELHRRIAPYMLRRLKRDVAPELPEILVNNRYVDMSPHQVQIHATIRQGLVDLIKEVSQYTVRDEDGDIVRQHPRANQINGMFILLQEVCDTLELLQMSDSRLAQKYLGTKNLDVKSPKVVELCDILNEFIEHYSGEGKPKAVIFTQFERMQRIIVAAISRFGGVRMINGSMDAAEKQRNIQEFKTRNDVSFLVCTDSANYGVNLQEASLLVKHLPVCRELRESGRKSLGLVA